MICLGSFIFSTAALTIILCFLFFFNSLFLASFLAWSVGFINFPLLVEEVERRPIVPVRLLHPFIQVKPAEHSALRTQLCAPNVT